GTGAAGLRDARGFQRMPVGRAKGDRMNLPRTVTGPTQPQVPQCDHPSDGPRRPEGRPRVALVAGSAARPAGELETVLRKRLRASAVVVAVFGLVQTASLLPSDFQRLRAAPVEAFTRPPWHGLVLLVTCLAGGLAVWLSPRRPTNLTRLRAAEWLLIAPVLALSAWGDIATLPDSLAEDRYRTSGYIHWALMMVG